jgi:hypothetical protein
MKGFTVPFRIFGGLVLLALLLAAAAHAAEPSMWEASARKPVPAGAKVTLATDRREYFLGENVLVHFTLENTSDQPIEADFGGDYRGATRALRFKVTATDESGRLAEDPDPSEFFGGGFGGGRKLNPGDRFTQSLPLVHYCRILQPGRYTIRVTHDFGWKEGERKRPIGEITVIFRMPTPTEAEAVVVAMEKLPADPNNTYGERAREYADFTALCQPIYLQPLLRRVEKGDRNALEGICWIATPAATAALIGLATNSNSKLALEAAQTLTMRLPDPALESTNGFGGFPPFTKEARRKLAKNSWDAKLAPAVQSLATNYLARPENPEIAAGAFMIQAVGTTNEAPAVRSALDRALDPLVRGRRDPGDDILDQPEPVRQLLNAMTALRDRGYTFDEDHLSGDGAFLLYFSWLANKPPPRPERWLHVLEVFGENCRFPTRVAALNSIPETVPDDCIAFVKSRMADDDLGVVRAACTVAGRSGKKTFLKPLLEIIATEHHEWLLREATDAANKLGAGFDLQNIWADRLAEEHLYGLALDSLQTVIEGLPGGSTGRTDLTRGERIELRNQWKTFLTKHADELRSGKKFKVDDPALTPALFGHARTWQLPNGKFWPITWEEMDRTPQK